MNYKHLSQIERYQIASLMKAQHSITQIASLIGRHKSTISRELRRNAGRRAKQACELAPKRSESDCNASTQLARQGHFTLGWVVVCVEGAEIAVDLVVEIVFWQSEC